MTIITYTEYVSKKQWSANEVVKELRKRGAELTRTKGSHAQYQFGNCRTTVPMHRGDLAKGTVRAMERDFEPAFGKGWLK